VIFLIVFVKKRWLMKVTFAMYGLPSETILVISSEESQQKGPTPCNTVFAK
jgi:hypothetical protein